MSSTTPRSSTVRTVAFDFGGVVVRWSMAALFREFFATDRAMHAFLTEVLTPAENLKCDLGMPLAQVVAPLIERFPEHAAPLEAWRDRWLETIPSDIAGTAELIDDLKAAGLGVVGLSNFSSQTFPWCRAKYPVFDKFDHIVLSGIVGVAKPDPAIYHHLCSVVGLDPGEILFFDDHVVNVDGAQAVGMESVLFTDADQARSVLVARGVLDAKG